MNEELQNEYVDVNVHDDYPSSDEHITVPPMKVLPLKKICMTIGQLPTAYLETMTYYEMLLWFIGYLRDNIIPTVNNNGEALQEVQTIVMSLQNYINNFKDSIDQSVEDLENYVNDYFENLDVQEEINNKLEDMLEQGTLQEIIEEYIQNTCIWCFDTVNDMKQANNLTDGSFAKTLGYYSANDGGGALYKIYTKTESDTDNGGSIIELNNTTLVAKMVESSVVNVLTWGVKKEDTTTQSNLDNLLDYYEDGNIVIYFPAGEYRITESINLPTKTKITGDSGATTLKWYGTDNQYMIQIERGKLYCTICNLTIDGNSSGYGIQDCVPVTVGSGDVRSKIYNLILNNVKIGLRSSAMGSEYYNILCNGDRLYTDETSIGLYLSGTDNFIHDCRFQRFGLGIYIEDNNNRLVTVKSCVNGTGVKIFNGSGGLYNIDIQENFRDNLIVDSTKSATFIMSNQLAGMDTQYVNGSSLQYSLIKIQNCSGLVMSGSLGGRIKIGDGSCGNEKYIIYVDDISTYITADFVYEYRFHPQSVLLDKPLFYVYEDETNKVVVNNEEITGLTTVGPATIASVAGTGATQSVTYSGNEITINLKSTVNLPTRQNVCIFTLSNMNDPAVYMFNSNTIYFERFIIQFANYTNNKYMSFEQGFTLQSIVKVDGGCLFKVSFDGLTAILNEHLAEIEAFLGGQIEASRFMLGGYASQHSSNKVTIDICSE